MLKTIIILYQSYLYITETDFTNLLLGDLAVIFTSEVNFKHVSAGMVRNMIFCACVSLTWTQRP